MRSYRIVPLLLVAAMLAPGGAHGGTCPQADAGPRLPDWHDAISEPDHVRLRDWRNSLVTALAQARKDGHGGEIDAAGPLFDPDAGLDAAALPPGDYRCRTIKLGAKAAGHATYVAYPAYPCTVHRGETLNRLTQTEGVQRPTGRLFPDGSGRMVFLGVMVLGDEPKAIKYGRDYDRNLAGALQRIGDGRWRLLLPDPAWESTMDVMEIVPAPPGAGAAAAH